MAVYIPSLRIRGARTGTFDNITTDLAFFTPSLIYNANDVQVLMTANNVGFASVGTDFVQRDVANSLEELGAGNAMYDAFSSLTYAQAAQALDDLSGEHMPGVTGTMAEAAGIIPKILSTRMQALSHQDDGTGLALLAPMAGVDDLASIVPNGTASLLEQRAGTNKIINAANRVWTEAFGTAGHTNGRSTSSQQDRGSMGLMAGIDRQIDTDTYIGFFGGYESLEMNTYSESASSQLNNYHAGLYASHQLNGHVRLNGGFGSTFHDINTQRYVVFPGFSGAPQGDTTGFTAMGFVETSYAFLRQDNLGGEIFTNIALSYAHMNGYTESGGGASNLEVDSSSAFAPSQTLGVRMGKSFTTEKGKTIRMNGSLGWQHAYGDLMDKASMRFATGSSEFVAYGPGRTPDSVLVGLGVQADLNDGASLHGGYNGTLSSNSQDHAFTISAKFSF